ncbi:acetyl-CoA carboxylase carboxyltransferase subunit alpha [Parvibaculum sp.]|uniref:acetyl-CoA carboxylase carboxyltransferase subunit alpha n=1 Tax=Parvibaculum sp. TaxID=2024848 RepID=UPI0027161606|nr:acetyl-CoA carboxylase carboxyltransferase subunit alpha [Parvibaculum sp.]MDO9125768.1 acetyl-CoA carboxylase carboxyltransferase subunit alpha [Parvibaculum sp.]MDP1625630.1 acetyl-CoA carboxylase carboxyltransferase subunit alpha [Parvibaculum sp.]MDP2148993.1 acetyl-CoA carboxylase carboxyltransferase subunit alpha [Parvibaculum sp.]MDP3328611.1 acetyl-CoA carboxylase carboxyltransferase subunit alpha [Parvibaculum sp.]
MHTYLDFEKPIAELEGKVQELKLLAQEDPSVSIGDEVSKLEQKAAQLLQETYASLSPWQKVQVARHPARPHFLDYVERLAEDFTPLAGDRLYGEDSAIVGGLGRFRGRSVMFIGHEKGSDTQSRIKHNFGMARPEGYRKAIRLMTLAERFGIPVVTLADTSGAYPGMESEERSVAEAIARSTDRCLSLGVPLISVIIGEGMSGGAIGIACGNRVLMLEHSIYSVISPEGASSILWRSSDKAKEAATAMKITAQHLHELGVVDRVLPEPIGGAHRERHQMIKETGDAIAEELKGLEKLDATSIRRVRREKFLAMGRIGLS